MRSTIGVAAAVVLLLAVPIAFVSQLVVDGSAELVIHALVGTGCVLLARRDVRLRSAQVGELDRRRRSRRVRRHLPAAGPQPGRRQRRA